MVNKEYLKLLMELKEGRIDYFVRFKLKTLKQLSCRWLFSIFVLECQNRHAGNTVWEALLSEWQNERGLSKIHRINGEPAQAIILN